MPRGGTVRSRRRSERFFRRSNPLATHLMIYNLGACQAEPEQIVRDLAHRVLATLMTPPEIDEQQVSVQVERRRVDAPWSEFDVSDSADLYTVSFDYPGSFRLV